MSQFKDEAEALTKALKIGISNVAQAIAWSDAQIAREDSPPAALCEVSTSHDRYPQDVAALLRQIPGTPVDSRVKRLLLLLMRESLTREPGCADKIASALALADEIEAPELKSIAWRAWDGFDLDDAGHTTETREQITSEMIAALQEATASDGVCWSFTFE